MQRSASAQEPTVPDDSKVVTAQRARARGRRFRLTGGDRKLQAGSFVIGLVLWELVGRFVVTNPLFFAPFSSVMASVIRLTREGVLVNDFIVTVQEVIYGLAGAIVVGVFVGFLIGLSRTARVALQPWLNALYSTPLAALAPLFILWFGIGQASKVATVFVSAIFPIIINSAAGIATTDQNFVDVARSFGLSKGQVFRKVLLPSALAFIATGVRLAVGRGLVGAVVAELFGAQAGLGFRIYVSGQAFQTADLLAGVLVLAATGVVAIGLVERIERRLAPWRVEVAL